jgi:tetratricopeptide (TPR) repeat protein
MPGLLLEPYQPKNAMNPAAQFDPSPRLPDDGAFQKRYRLEGELGRGGMGVVYRAHDTLLDRPVAVKVLSPAPAGAKDESGLDTEGRARLLHEAQAIARLHHPNIVAVYDAGEAELPGTAGPAPYIVLELVEGQSLYERRPTVLEEIVGLARQICAALAQAHAHGVIHRDLKPENVMLTPDGTAKLMDFGLARSVASRLTTVGAVVGTVFYLAPELALGQPFDARADLYALGVMLYELTTGRLPFAADDPVAVISQHVYAPVVPPNTYNPALPAALDQLIVRLMSKDPAGRPASAEAVRAALELPGALETAAPAEAAAPPAAELLVLDRIVRGRLVGRREELMQLQALWAMAGARRGHLALISGEPGIGKSRLARELMVYARLSGALVLTGGCYEYEAAVPYLPFVEALRAWAETQTTEALCSQVGPGAPGLAWLVPELGARLGALEPDPPLPSSDERLRLFESLARLFQSLAAPHGLLLVLDDLHWADQGTLALLHYLLRRLRDAHFLIVAAYREGELDQAHPLAGALVEWNRERVATRVRLGRLSLADSGALLAALFGQESVTPEFAAAIHRETEGNPFFIEEVVKLLVEKGDIYRVAGAWDRKAIEDLAVPQSIKEAIGRRLNRLSAACVETLQAAAMLGKTFAFEELAAAGTQAEDRLLDALDEAGAAQLIRPEVGEAFVFTHDKIREVLYEALNPIRRRRLHRRIGVGLEQLYADPAARAEHAPGLAHHFVLGGEPGKGLTYSLQAAAQARRLFALDEAVRYYQHASQAAQALSAPAQWAAIEAELAEVHYQRGLYQLAVEHYQHALDGLAPDDQARRAAFNVKIGLAYTQLGDERGLDFLQRAERELDPLTQSDELANALSGLGRYHHYRSQFRQALEFQERARHLAERQAQASTLSLVYTHLAGAYQQLAQYSHSSHWARQSISLGQAANDPWAVALGYEFLAESAIGQGYWSEALEYAARDREITEKIGALDRLAWADFASTWAYHGRGDLQRGLDTGQATLALAEEIGEGRLAILMAPILAWIETDLGLDDDVAAKAPHWLQRTDELGQVFAQCLARHGLAYYHIQRAEWSEAAALYAQCAALYGPTDNRQTPLFLGPYPALAHLGLGQTGAAAQFADDYLALAREVEAPHWVGCAQRVRGQILTTQGRPAEAAAAFDEAISLLAQCSSRLELGRAYYQRAGLWRAPDERAAADLAQARALFEACGAPRDRQRAAAGPA